MVERNIGNVERLLRLVVGISLFVWLCTRTDINGIEVFVGVVSVFLILNGIFSRCYLWYLLDIDTTLRERASSECDSV